MKPELKAKLEQVNEQIATKNTQAQEKWTAFEQCRSEFASAGNEANRTDSDAFKKAEDVHKEYATVSAELKDLEGVRDGIFRMLSVDGSPRPTTQAEAKQTEAEDIKVGVSIDQVLARKIGQDTALPSIEVATEDFSGYVGGCVPGYSCAYMNTISWASETQPQPMETNPRTAFERLFGRASTTAEREARVREDRSILDSVAEEARAL